jgi:formylglycine-generating enzyme required for sulfatase activity
MAGDQSTPLRNQLQQAEEKLRLIRERKAEYILSTDVPLDLVREERILLSEQARLIELIAHLKDTPCPYHGLESFGVADALEFCGRTQAIRDLVGQVDTNAFGVVIGPSGSGKSSLVNAGLRRQLELQAPPWAIFPITPGKQPLRTLCRTLVDWTLPDASAVERSSETSKLLTSLHDGALALRDFVVDREQEKKGQPFLLIVDQFEEIFTETSDSITQQRYVDLILDLAEAGQHTHVLCVVRADFYGHLLQHARLGAAVVANLYNVLPMRPDELREAIEQPALACGCAFEAGLVDQILADVVGEPGILPLLQFALTQLWEYQTADGLLTYAQYRQIGGVRQSLTRYADDVLAALDEAQTFQAERIFKQLVRPGEDTPDTRRIATRQEIGAANWPLVEHLAQRRLVVLNRAETNQEQETVEVAHEALIREWPQLRQWIEGDRPFRLWQERLRIQLREWQSNSQDEGALLRGVLLREAETWFAERAQILSADECQFIKKSSDLHTREEAEREQRVGYELALERKASQQLRALLIGASMVAIAALILAGFLAYPRVLPLFVRTATTKIPAGEAVIGTDDSNSDVAENERPEIHPIVLEFAIERTEVSNAQYQQCVTIGSCTAPLLNVDFTEKPNNPVVGVSAYQANQYCQWVGRRLPTELEWERAARGAHGNQWPWGNDMSVAAHANILPDGPARGSEPVDSHGADGREGVVNLAGNVWEWTTSYDQPYTHYDMQLIWQGRPDLTNVEGDLPLIQRGGGWEDRLERITERVAAPAFEPRASTGFRCAVSP